MGSLDIKSDQKVSEQELEVTNNESESIVNSPTTSDEDDLIELISDPTSASDSDANELTVHSPTFNDEKASSSSSTSSSDFMLEDPFQDSDYSHGKTTNKGIDYTIESPPIQTMERASPTPPKYRIPSSVFARKESNNIDGWGMPSNESLFSIKMGGMSFRNQDSMSWRSDDLDLGFGIETSPSNILMIHELDEICESDGSEKNVEQDEVDKDPALVEGGRHHKLGEEEDKIQSLSEIGNNHGSRIADESMNLKLHGDQEGQGGEAVVEELNSQFSAENIGSKGSFAFPILTADENKGPSPTVTGSRTKTFEPQLDTAPHTEPQPEPDKQTEQPKANPPAATWTNCFGCCTFCS